MFTINRTNKNNLRKTLTNNEGILSTIGSTPLVKLNKAFIDNHFQVFGKMELFNPGGSIKDRPAFNMIKSAWEQGYIQQDTTIIESSSGNLGIGIAQVCMKLGLNFICVVDALTNEQNIKMLKAYGADVLMVKEPDPVTGEFLPARIKLVKSLLETIPRSFWCNQYANLNNARAHYQTMDEIVKQLNQDIDYLFCATSSCGTLRGCYEYIKSNNLKTKIIAVDAEGSVIFGKKGKKRLIPGHGSGRVPELFQSGMESMFIHVSDLDCVKGCYSLLRREAILAGGSSGGIISAIEKIKEEINRDSVCVAIICDRGERYLDTIYSETWVKNHFPDFDNQIFQKSIAL